jgi:uncharacterized OsmC-like protein
MTDSQVRAALERLSQTIADQPEKAKAKHASATAVLESGVRCRVTGSAGEQIATDMPPAMGGNASGPNPGWFFRASLASCCATVIAMRAARLGVNLTTLEVTVESDGDHRGILGLDERISAGMSSLRTTVRIGRGQRRCRPACRPGPMGRRTFSGRMHRAECGGEHA